MQEIVQRYMASWNETDPERRRKLVDELWDDQASYIDPLAEAHGRDAIDAVIAAAQAQFPGFVFTLNGPVDAHHQQARFTWALGPADAEPVATPGPNGVAADPGRQDLIEEQPDKHNLQQGPRSRRGRFGRQDDVPAQRAERARRQ